MPGQRHESHHRICNLRYGTHGYEMSAYKGDNDKIQSFSMSCDSSMIKGTPPGFSSLGSAARNWIDGFSQPEYCMLHSLGLIKNRTDLFSGFWERPVLRK